MTHSEMMFRLGITRPRSGGVFARQCAKFRTSTIHEMRGRKLYGNIAIFWIWWTVAGVCSSITTAIQKQDK